MKKILSITLALVMAVTLAACSGKGQPLPRLSAPQNVEISATGTITWDAVENATSYVVKIGSDENATTATSYQVQDTSAAFTFGVYAKAEGYADSEVSEGTFTPAPPAVTGVTISGPSSVKSGGEIDLKALVKSTGQIGDSGVNWSVTSGGNAATVSSSGKFTANEVSRNTNVVVRATSKADNKVYAEKTITILARIPLTQDMLDKAGAKTAEFSGMMTIDAYTIGIFPRLSDSYELTLKTVMDGEHWYAEYVDSYSNAKREMYCATKDNDGLTYQVVLGYNNEEEYIPMIAPDGTTENWEEYGLYNGFTGLKVSDFELDEETYTYKYVGEDKTLAARMAAAANPYDFAAKEDGLSLIVAPGMILGFRIAGEDDYSVAPGYRSETALQITINVASTVTVPTIEKHKTEEYHNRLAEAITNMKALESYKTTVFHTFNSAYGSGHNGYIETVTADTCLFRDITYDGFDNAGSPTNMRYSGAPYGFKDMGDGKYDMFYGAPAAGASEWEYTAQRAYTADFSEAKPGFGFAAEIFTLLPGSAADESKVPEEERTNACDYMMLDLNLATVTTEFYASASADMQIYGIYATSALFTGGTVMYPYVTVETLGGEEYITGSGFFYNMGIMYGVIEILYSDFNAAKIEEDISFEPRVIPTKWEDLTFEDLENNPTNAKKVIESAFTSNPEAANKVPFIDVLGDAFGFAILDTYRPYGETRLRPAAALYYDVPLDRNYSIATSINAVASWLRDRGFTGNDHYEFENEDLGVGIALVDRDLDFYIYVYALT